MTSLRTAIPDVPGRMRWTGALAAWGVLLCVAPGASGLDHKAGDLNDDGCVNITDFNLLKASFGGTPPDPCKAAGDIDQDGDVDIVDSNMFSNFYFLAPVACRPTTSPFGCNSYTSCEVVCEDICNLPDNGSGTVDLPPDGCSYLSPGNFHAIVDSLPPDTQLEVSAAHRGFTNITRTPGGSLGGEIEEFDSEVRLEIHGRGTLIDYQRVIVMGSVPVEIHTGPKQDGQSYQQFPADMRSIVAEITPADADPDFDLLRITAGSDFGMPSPGVTKLFETASFDLDSEFEVNYQIEMVGDPGGPLAGLSSTTTGVVTMGTPSISLPVPSLSPIAGGLLVAAGLLLSLGMHLHRRRR